MQKYVHLLAVVLLGLAVAGCGAEPTVSNNQPGDNPVGADSLTIQEIVGLAKIEPAGRILSIYAAASGRITEVRARENQEMAANEVILVLDHSLESAQLQQAESRLGAQRAAIRVAEANLATREVNLAEARSHLSRQEQLFAGSALTQAELDAARFALQDQEKQRVAAQATVEEQRRRLDQLEADIGYARAVVAQKTVRAPLAGRFLSVDARVGSYLSNTTSIGDFAPTGPLMAVTEVDELFADQVQVGQRAYIRMQGSLQRLAEGTVVFVGPYLKRKSLFSDRSDNLEDRRVRELHIQLPDQTPVLIGSRVESVILLDRPQPLTNQ